MSKSRRVNERANAWIMTGLGGLLTPVGVLVLLSGLRGTASARSGGPVIFERSLAQGAGAALEMKQERVPLPPNTERVSVDLVASYRSQGTYRAEAHVEGGKAPWSGSTSWSDQKLRSPTGVVRRVGIAPVGGATATVSVTVTPPVGAAVSLMKVRMLANPADEVESAEQQDIFVGLVLLAVGLATLIPGILLWRKIPKDPWEA